MSNYTSHLKENQKMKLAAATAKPDQPRFGEQTKIAKDMFDFDEHFNSKVRGEDAQLASELSQKWAGNGGGTRGDAFISGLQSGMRKGSILDDKKRMEKYKTGMEKMHQMVESQNQQLYQQEKLHNARQSIMPNWMAYSQSFRGMSPSDREQAVESMIQKYNDVAGTNYKRYSVDGREPWKVTVIDGQEAMPVDLMDLMKTPEEMRMQIMMNSPGYQQMEGVARGEHNMEQADKQAGMDLKKSKIDALRQESQDLQSFKEMEETIKQESGDSVISLDRFINKPSQWNHAIKGIEKRIEQGNTAHKGMQTLDRLNEIVDTKPQLFGTFDAIIANNNSANPTLLSTLATKLKVKDEDRADFEEAGKLFAYLYQDALHSLPSGTRNNQYLEREIKKGIPSMGQVPEAFKRITSHIGKDFVYPAEVGKKTSEYYQQGLEYKPKVREYKAPEKKIKLPGGQSVTADDLRAKEPRLKEFTDEEIYEWAKTKGAK